MDTIQIIHACIATLDRISVTGFDNADRYVGVMQTLKQLVAKLEAEQEESDG